MQVDYYRLTHSHLSDEKSEVCVNAQCNNPGSEWCIQVRRRASIVRRLPPPPFPCLRPV